MRMTELRVDTGAIAKNAEAVAVLLRQHGLDLVGVTKGCLGEPRVAEAMMEGGAAALADTRDENLLKLRAALPRVELHRIHLPSLRSPFEPGDLTYVSSWAGAEAVAALGALERPHVVMLQVETGDEREGAPLELVPELAAAIAADPRFQLAGISTNYACFRGGPCGIRDSLAMVAEVAAALRAAGLDVPRVSGGNSSALWLLTAGETLPSQVTELRCGEALLLGQDALHYQALPGCRADACLLRAEVLEDYARLTAMGRVRRLVLGIGRQDLGAGKVRFLEPNVVEIGRSADYLVAEATRSCAGVSVGTTLDMIPSYEALVAAWTSPYVELRLL